MGLLPKKHHGDELKCGGPQMCSDCSERLGVIDEGPSLEELRLLTSKATDDKCKCGKESTVGVHLVENGKIVDKYYCDDDWNRKTQKDFQ